MDAEERFWKFIRSNPILVSKLKRGNRAMTKRLFNSVFAHTGYQINLVIPGPKYKRPVNYVTYHGKPIFRVRTVFVFLDQVYDHVQDKIKEL